MVPRMGTGPNPTGDHRRRRVARRLSCCLRAPKATAMSPGSSTASSRWRFLLAAEATKGEDYTRTVEGISFTLVLYWIAHTYGRVTGSRIEGRAPLRAREIVRASVHELAILRGAVCCRCSQSSWPGLWCQLGRRHPGGSLDGGGGTGGPRGGRRPPGGPASLGAGRASVLRRAPRRGPRLLAVGGAVAQLTLDPRAGAEAGAQVVTGSSSSMSGAGASPSRTDETGVGSEALTELHLGRNHAATKAMAAIGAAIIKTVWIESA